MGPFPHDAPPATISADNPMGTDGFEFVETMRRNDDWKSVPIIVVTAKNLTEEDHARLNSYVQEIIRKSSRDIAQVLRAVRAHVQAASASSGREE